MGCQIAANEIRVPGGDIWRDDEWQAGHDPNNFIPGFIVFGTIRHVHSILEIPDTSLQFCWRLIKNVRQILGRQYGIEKFVTIQDDETFGHFHISLLPVCPEMRRFGGSVENIVPFLNWSKKAWNTPEKTRQIEETADRLRFWLNTRR